MRPLTRGLALAFALAAAAAAACSTVDPAPVAAPAAAPAAPAAVVAALPVVTIAYRTLGDPSGEPVPLLHGASGNGSNFLSPAFAGEMLGPGQSLDVRRYFVILPDAIGTGGSSKPSDGLRAKFPRYSYEDMVDAQHRLVVEGLGIRRLRLVFGNSMDAMMAWVWATR